MDEQAKQALVVVEDDQLSLAIGKRGQNVRLAAKLTGWPLGGGGGKGGGRGAVPRGRQGRGIPR